MLMFVFRRGQGFSETKFAGESASKSDSICAPKSARKSMSISRLSTSKWRLAREAASKSDANLSRNLLANLCRNLNQTSRQFDETQNAKVDLHHMLVKVSKQMPIGIIFSPPFSSRPPNAVLNARTKSQIEESRSGETN